MEAAAKRNSKIAHVRALPANGSHDGSAVCEYVRASHTAMTANLSVTDLLHWPGDADVPPSAAGHYVCVPPARVARRRRGCLLFLGAGISRNFTRHAAAAGYDAISLVWWNKPSAECACGCSRWNAGRGVARGAAAEACEHATQLARLYGENDAEIAPLLAAHGNLTRRERLRYDDTIEARLLALLLFLSSPEAVAARAHRYAAVAGSFRRQYVHTTDAVDGGSLQGGRRPLVRPRWESISVCGHSRGGIYAYLLAQRYVLPRAMPAAHTHEPCA